MITVKRAVTITTIIYLVFMFGFATGAIHAIVEGTGQRGQVLLIPDRSTQTLTESVLVTLAFFLGLAGLYFVHKSTKPQTAKEQKVYFIAGFSIIAISLLGGFLLVGFKL